MKLQSTLKVLLVEDSKADARLIMEVFNEEKISVDISLVSDGEECMDYLRKQSPFEKSQRPDLIILDLNLPRKDGREVLSEIKAADDLKQIPVVILTTSQSDEDILRSYHLQASCYVTKPIDLNQFTKIIKSIDEFWFSAVRYPPKL